jgi:hypothetical protein
MAILKTKGTVFSMGVGGASLAIGQMISIDLPQAETETFEADTLDNSDVGIPYKGTGRVEGGSCGGEMFFDPSTQTGILGFLTAPPSPGDDPQGSGTITLPSAAVLSFDIAGVSLGGTIALNDGVKGTLTCKLDGAATWA